ncbi:MAG: UDP-N-acetylglucosamine 1-carboxyvinyltransferase [Deltaproteobacteria bacterium]|nr:UDP-N-acetylglucosamine 1-carboxyvinyltransferase [Deltaproteobacteria bacterium]
MDKIIIDGGRRLHGKVKISGSKNAALPLMAASILSRGLNVFENVPDLMDIHTMARLLHGFGVEVKEKRGVLKIRADKIKKAEAPYDLVRTMRASVLVLGPLLGRLGHARVSLPGGCAIGARPINRHLKAFEEMGAKIRLEGGYVEAACPKLTGARIVFDDITVTGTENVMMAAVLAKGATVIENSAREPEVPELANYLNRMGARITGAGTDTITIEGVDELNGADYKIMPDRIEAGTFAIASAMTGGDVLVQGVAPEHISSLIAKLREAGGVITEEDHSIHVIGPREVKNVDVSTQPYPGFATDFQAQFTSMMCLARGTSLVSENIFENRFMHVAELNRMGANIKLDGNSAVVTGVEQLIGAPVMATDLRASACLILAGLMARGITEIHRVYHLDRGYEHIERKFRKLGARVKRGKVKY